MCTLSVRHCPSFSRPSHSFQYNTLQHSVSELFLTLLHTTHQKAARDSMQLTAEARFAKLPAASWLTRLRVAQRAQKQTNTIWGAKRLRVRHVCVSHLLFLFVSSSTACLNLLSMKMHLFLYAYICVHTRICMSI